MKKVVFKLDLYDDKVKQKAMKAVSRFAGIDSIAMDMKDKKLTVTGDVDAVAIVAKLRKLCDAEIVSVGPAKDDAPKVPLPFYHQPYDYQQYPTQYISVEKDLNACVIC